MIRTVSSGWHLWHWSWSAIARDHIDQHAFNLHHYTPRIRINFTIINCHNSMHNWTWAQVADTLSHNATKSYRTSMSRTYSFSLASHTQLLAQVKISWTWDCRNLFGACYRSNMKYYTHIIIWEWEMIGGHWYVNGSTLMGTKIVRSWFAWSTHYFVDYAKPRSNIM